MFHFILSFIYVFVLVLITVYVSSHNNVMLLISCHAIYIFLSLILCFMHANTLEVDTKKKLYVPEGTITVRDSDLCHRPKRGLDICKLYAAATISL